MVFIEKSKFEKRMLTEKILKKIEFLERQGTICINANSLVDQQKINHFLSVYELYSLEQIEKLLPSNF